MKCLYDSRYYTENQSSTLPFTNPESVHIIKTKITVFVKQFKRTTETEQSNMTMNYQKIGDGRPNLGIRLAIAPVDWGVHTALCKLDKIRGSGKTRSQTYKGILVVTKVLCR